MMGKDYMVTNKSSALRANISLFFNSFFEHVNKRQKFAHKCSPESLITDSNLIKIIHIIKPLLTTFILYSSESQYNLVKMACNIEKESIPYFVEFLIKHFFNISVSKPRLLEYISAIIPPLMQSTPTLKFKYIYEIISYCINSLTTTDFIVNIKVISTLKKIFIYMPVLSSLHYENMYSATSQVLFSDYLETLKNTNQFAFHFYRLYEQLEELILQLFERIMLIYEALEKPNKKQPENDMANSLSSLYTTMIFRMDEEIYNAIFTRIKEFIYKGPYCHAYLEISRLLQVMIKYRSKEDVKEIISYIYEECLSKSEAPLKGISLKCKCEGLMNKTKIDECISKDQAQYYAYMLKAML